jgi:hypothetical protein
MMYRDKTMLFVDNGLFVEFAALLGKEFGTVYYFMPWESAFPTSNERLVGVGIPGITKIYNMWEVFDEVDIFCFPDVYSGELQEWLAKHGKRVWGARTAEFLELDRHRSKQVCEELGIDIGPYSVVTGLDELRDYLRGHKKQYVKVSTTRGDFETFLSENYALSEPKVDELEAKLGAKKRVMQFIVEEAIEPAIEVGYDGYTIDGKFSELAMFGLEIKDRGFVLECRPYRELPEALRYVNDKLAPLFARYQYRGFWSSEIRIKGDKFYLIDPCCRAGVPPNELFQVMVSNWAEIIWEGAGGTVVEPEFNGKFGAELLLRSSWASRNWQPVEIPERFKTNVKLHNAATLGGKFYTVPQGFDVAYVGGVACVSNTLQDAVDLTKYVASKVHGYYLEVFDESLDSAIEEYEKVDDLE